MVRFLSSSSSTAWTVEGEAGNDTFEVGVGDYDTNIQGAITVNGGTDTDVLLLDDTNDGGSTDRYILTRTTFTKNSPGMTVGTLTYSGVNEITLDGSNSSTPFDIQSIPTGVSVTVNGQGGADVFTIAGGDYDTNIKSTLTVNGGSGTDELLIDDTNDGGSTDSYILTNTTFTKDSPGMTVGTLTYSNMEDITLDGSDEDSTFLIQSVSAGVSVIVNGRGGEDVFVVGGGGL